MDIGGAAIEGAKGTASGTAGGAAFGTLAKYLPRVPSFFRRIPAKEGVSRANQVRQAAGGSGQALKGTRNVSVGDAHLQGAKVSRTAVSGKSQPELPGNAGVPAAHSRLLPPSGTIKRPVDSERLVLEFFARIIPKTVGGSRVRGTVSIFSERVPCSACREAAGAFEKLYEGAIKVVFTSRGS
jgi:hypothetical protein